MATALNPYLGYEKAAALAKEAFTAGKTIREVCLEKKVLTTIAGFKPRHLAYVSCAADTLARDTAILTQHRYTLQSIQLMDMFPRTPYFETLAYFTREH